MYGFHETSLTFSWDSGPQQYGVFWKENRGGGISRKESGRTKSPAFVLCNAPGLLLFYFLLNVVNGFDGFDY